MTDMTWDELVAAYAMPGEALTCSPEHEAVLVARKMDAERRAELALTPEQVAADETP
jgi:hypothetical protein